MLLDRVTRRHLVSFVLGAAPFSRSGAAPAAIPAKLSGAAVSVTLVDVLPDRKTDALVMLRRYAAEARNAPGCVELRPSEEEPPLANHYVTIAVWRSMADWVAQHGSRSVRTFRDALQPLLLSPVDDERIFSKALS